MRVRDSSKLTFGASTRVYLLKIEEPVRSRPGQGSAASTSASGLSVQEKRKLLWGNKRGAGGVSLSHQRTAEVNASGWVAQAAGVMSGDAERQDKFLSMMGAKRHKLEGQEGVAVTQSADADAAAAAAAAQRQAAIFDTLENQFHSATQTQRSRHSFGSR